MNSIKIVRARYVINLIAVLREMDAPIDRYLEHAYIPEGLLADQENVLSGCSLQRFLESAVEDTKCFDLAFTAGATPLHDHGVSGKRILEAPNLFHAIQRMRTFGKTETSGSDFFLTHEDGMAWFSTGPIDGGLVLQQQTELYRVRVMLQLLQTALGEQWRPERMRLKYVSGDDVAGNELLDSLNVEYGALMTGISVPIEKLSVPMPEVNWDRRETASHLLDVLTLDPLTALRRLLVSYLPYGPSIELIAKLSGSRKRTMQRFLSDMGLSFTALLEQVIFNQAVLLLNEKSDSITDISYQLGYSNVSHFSRAFRRLTGLSPSTYRKMVCG